MNFACTSEKPCTHVRLYHTRGQDSVVACRQHAIAVAAAAVGGGGVVTFTSKTFTHVYPTKQAHRLSVVILHPSFRDTNQVVTQLVCETENQNNNHLLTTCIVRSTTRLPQSVYRLLLLPGSECIIYNINISVNSCIFSCIIVILCV